MYTAGSIDILAAVLVLAVAVVKYGPAWIRALKESNDDSSDK